jgi:C_GCAxxG_C_C family probable redox protein
MERAEKARALFLSGNNCAQSVLLSFADDLKYSKELALKLAAGFGAGMGRAQETCGAVTGGMMVLGVMKGEEVGGNDELKAEAYASVKELMEEFTKARKSTNCRELIGVDLNTPEGAREFKDKGLMEHVCASCVEEAVQIVEKLGKL